jgi:hypothetical protein
MLTTFLAEGGSFVAEDEAVRGDRRAASCRAVLYAKLLRRSGEITFDTKCSPSCRPRLRDGADRWFACLLRDRPERATLACVDDQAIRSLVIRLGRAHPSGGTVIERAAIVAEGADSEAVMRWIDAHGGKPETTVETSTRRGLHGSRVHESGGAAPRTASRFVLPAGALD